MKLAFVAVGAAYLSVAAVSGQNVEKDLRAMVSTMQADWPMIRVTDEHYDRHLLTATHTFTLRPACDAPGAGASAPQTGITIVQHVKYGPLPGLGKFGAATVDTELAMDAATRAQVAKLFDADSPFQAHTDVAFNGATRTHLVIAPLRASDAKGQQVDFQGLTGDIDNDGRTLEYDVHMPALSATVAASAPTALSLDVKNMHLHARVQGAGDWSMRPGKSEGEIEAVRVSVAASSPAASHDVTFNQLKFSRDTSLDKKLVTTILRMDGIGQVDDTKIDRIEFQSTMRRFDAVAYQALVRRFVASGQQSCGKGLDPAKQMASPQVQAALAHMLSANPEISLDKLVVEVGGRRAELGYTIGVNGFTAADAKLPMPAILRTRGYGSVRFKLPEDWVRNSMDYLARHSNNPGGAGDRAAIVDMMLGKVIDQGYVVREDGMLRSEAAFKGGRATINGKPVGVPAPASAVTVTAKPM